MPFSDFLGRIGRIALGLKMGFSVSLDPAKTRSAGSGRVQGLGKVSKGLDKGFRAGLGLRVGGLGFGYVADKD